MASTMEIPFSTLTKKTTENSNIWKNLAADLHLKQIRLDARSRKKRARHDSPDDEGLVSKYSKTVHMFEIDQLWHSVEIRNSSLLPQTRRMVLRNLLRINGEHSKHASNSMERDEVVLQEGSSEDEEDIESNADEENYAPEGVISRGEGSELTRERSVAEMKEIGLQVPAWMLRGEVLASSRPKNSLLNSTIIQDSSAKQVYRPDNEHQEKIEDMIKQRVVDGNFDDVEYLSKAHASGQMHELLINTPRRAESKDEKLPAVSDEKSKTGLAELYEEAFIDRGAHEPSETNESVGSGEAGDSRAPREVSVLLDKICSKLDLLCGYSTTSGLDSMVTRRKEKSTAKEGAQKEQEPETRKKPRKSRRKR